MRSANRSATRSVSARLPNGSRRGPAAKADTDAELIVDTLWPLVQQGVLAIPRGGYLLRRGRGRIIVEPAKK